MAQPLNTLNVHASDPITPAEVQWAYRMLDVAFPGKTLRHKWIDVAEPVKQEVVPYIEAERLGEPLPRKPSRLVENSFHQTDDWPFFKALLNVYRRIILSARQLPAGTQGPVDAEEMIAMEEASDGMRLACEPWMYGTDDPHETRRLFQCYLYVIAVDHPENNHYSLPVSFSPVFGAFTPKFVRMDCLPDMFDGNVAIETSPWKPVDPIQYANDLLDRPVRTDLKPYTAIQPEGPSFSVTNNLVDWQKWRFPIGWNAREGLILYNVTYDKRDVFYRVAVSEMTVPYGDPRPPYHRKQAFDVGDVGTRMGQDIVPRRPRCSHRGRQILRVHRARVFKIRNDSVINPITYKPLAYKLQAMPSQMLLMDPTSYNHRRAGFATRPIWVTKYHDGELYAAGEFTNQSQKPSGVNTWALRHDSVENEDIVRRHTFGITHNPRIEDLPIMPVERISLMLKPDGFFTQSPALTYHVLPRRSTSRPSTAPSRTRKLARCCGGEEKSNL